MDIHAMNSRQLSQLAQLGTDELADKCFVPTDEVGKDGKIGGRSVRLATKAETDSATNLAMRNQILKFLGENYDIRGFEDEVRGLLGIPKEGGDASQASGENLVDAARVRDVVRYVQAKSAKVDEILDKVLVKVKFSDRVKAAFGKTLVSEASNDIVSKIINAEPPTLDDLTRLCKLAAQTHPQDTFEDKLAVAYLKGFSATIKGDVPTVSNLATRMEQLKAAERKGVADHQAEENARSQTGESNWDNASANAVHGMPIHYGNDVNEEVKTVDENGNQKNYSTSTDDKYAKDERELQGFIDGKPTVPDHGGKATGPETTNPETKSTETEAPTKTEQEPNVPNAGPESTGTQTTTNTDKKQEPQKPEEPLNEPKKMTDTEAKPVESKKTTAKLEKPVKEEKVASTEKKFSFLNWLFGEKSKPKVEPVADNLNLLVISENSMTAQLKTKLIDRLNQREAKGLLDFIESKAEEMSKKNTDISKDSFKEAISSCLINKMSGLKPPKTMNEIQDVLFKIVNPSLKDVTETVLPNAKFHKQCVDFVNNKQREISEKLTSDDTAEREIARDFMQRIHGFVNGTDTSLHRESVRHGMLADNALDSRWNDAFAVLQLKKTKLKNLGKVSAKDHKFDLAREGLTEVEAKGAVILQREKSNMCYIKSPINALLAAGQLKTVKSVLTPNDEGTYVFNLGDEVVKVKPDKSKTTIERVTVTKDQIAAIRKDGGQVYSDVELALFLAHNVIAERPIPLGAFGEADRVINCFGYQRASDLQAESKISINRSGITDQIKKATYLPDGLGAAMKKVYDAGRWLDRHKDGVMLLNISENHFVAVTGTYYTDDSNFGFIVRDSAGGNVRTVNVRESGEMFMLDAYVPNEYKPLM